MASSLNAVLFWVYNNFSKSSISSSVMASLWYFLLQIYMEAQVGSLLWVEVHFVLESTKQVSADLGLIYHSKVLSRMASSLNSVILSWNSKIRNPVLSTPIWNILSPNLSMISPRAFKQNCSPLVALQQSVIGLAFHCSVWELERGEEHSFSQLEI